VEKETCTPLIQPPFYSEVDPKETKLYCTRCDRRACSVDDIRRLALLGSLLTRRDPPLPRSPSMTCGFFGGDAGGQAQSVQVVFTIFADPPVFGSRDHNVGNLSKALHDLLCFFEASHVG
jgi:hypothetical protein